MYEFTSRVRYSEIKPDGKMSLTALITRMQDCSVFHSESIGRGPETWIAGGQGWMIISWQILIHSIPAFGVPITTKTWAYRFRGIEGDRNFTILDPEGNILAEANSRWIYFDLRAQKPMRVPEEEMNGFGSEEPLDSFVYSPRRIFLPKTEPVSYEPLRVQPMSIDTNGHVNNLAYIDMAIPYLPDSFHVKELRVQYNHQAHLKDLLIPKVYTAEDGICIALGLDTGEVCAIAQFL